MPSHFGTPVIFRASSSVSDLCDMIEFTVKGVG